MKNKNKIVASVIIASALFTAAVYATDTCSALAQWKCKLGMTEYCNETCQIR